MLNHASNAAFQLTLVALATNTSAGATGGRRA